MRLPPILNLARTVGPAVIAGLTIFCAPASPQAPAPSAHMESAGCMVRPDSAAFRRSDTVRVPLFDTVAAALAPQSGNDALRLVFRQMYETLVRINCEGTLVPGAAEKWLTGDSGLTWTFTLRDHLRFWDGSPYTPGEFARSFSGAAILGSASVDSLDQRTIRIRMKEPRDLPLLLTSSSFELHSSDGPRRVSGWPLGTGQYQPDTIGSVRLIRLLPVDSTASIPVLEFWQARTADPRDLLDRGADVMLTTDPSLIDYADKRGDRTTLPLPWNTTYFLQYSAPVESLPPALAPLADSVRGQELRRALSRDAVRAESRPSSLRTATVGSHMSWPRSTLRPPNLILYAPGDRTARDLAERLVALVPGRLHWSAVSFEDKRAAGGGIGSIGYAPVNSPMANGEAAIPLVDVRSHAILRRGTPAWVVDGDGTLRMPLPGTVPP